MKLLLLKTLLQRRARDEGFTLPMVIALGLVMLLLGAISITTANEENLTAISQNSKSDALAVAEVGVARYRELLDRNRVLTVYDSDQWGLPPGSVGEITEVCDNNIKTAHGSKVFKRINLRESGSDDLNSNGTLNEAQALMGEYSLFSYDYTNDDVPPIDNGTLNLTSDAANNNARGKLKVIGRAADGSEAQIEVEIPVRINPDDMTNLAPALWIGDNTVSAADLGNLTIGNGNVVIKDQAGTGTTNGCRNFSDTTAFPGLTTATRPVISDNRDLPPITKISTDVKNAGDVSIGNRTNTLDTTNPQVTYGIITDKAYNPDKLPSKFIDSDCKGKKFSSCRYYYKPNSNTAITYTDKNMVTDGIAKSTLLLEQDLTIEATSAATSAVKIGSSSTFGSSDVFEMYVNGSGNDITINVASGKTIDVRAFIHAPESKLTITGTGTVNIFGSLWVNDFENRTATVNITPDDIKNSSSAVAGDKAYKFYSTTPSRTPKPLTGSPTNWKTEEVE
jgi:hypothetical protein